MCDVSPRSSYGAGVKAKTKRSPNAVLRLATGYDGGPAINKHWIKVSWDVALFCPVAMSPLVTDMSSRWCQSVVLATTE